MAITSLDTYIAASRQRKSWYKTSPTTCLAPQATRPFFSLFGSAGSPGLATLAAGSTTTGIVPVDTDSGYMPITAFAAGTTGYLSRVQYASTVTGRISIFDRLWVGGAYSFNANTSGQSPTSYSSRVPNSDYRGLQLWYEQVTTATGIPSVNVSYNDENNTASTTGVYSLGVAPMAGAAFQIHLGGTDAGIRGVTGVTASVATVGTFNLMVLRPLWTGRVHMVNGSYIDDFLATGMPQVYDTSALYVLVEPDSTSTGFPEVNIEVASG